MGRAGGTGTDRDARLRAALRANLARRKARGAAVASPQPGGGEARVAETGPATPAFPDQDVPEPETPQKD
jgi:hypothetical protein